MTIENLENTYLKVLRSVKKTLRESNVPSVLIEQGVKLAVYKYHQNELDGFIKTKEMNITLCSACGRCCKECNIVMAENDLFRLNKAINVSQYVEPDPTKPGNYHFKIQPCHFQDKNNNKCLIYKARPNSCRNYPLTRVNDEQRIMRDPECLYAIRFLSKKALHIILSAIGGEGSVKRESNEAMVV